VTNINNSQDGEFKGAWSFCQHCGEKIAFSAINCPKCQKSTFKSSSLLEQKSSKNYGIAVSLCGIFGMIGLHHFYIGKYLHGLFDLTLFLSWAYIFFISNTSNGTLLLLGIFFFIIDFFHTIFVFYKLIVGEQTDGDNKLITH